ncbi:MAG TPA: hypothetical protein PKB13_09860 [Clostridia bacterium]|nr:hypothetical protein [Clostridia bacterium]
MRNVKPEVVAALLRALPRVFFSSPDDDADLPCISYLELNNTPSGGADDEEYTSAVEIAVDIWGENSPEEISAIALDVDREMMAIGFVRTSAPDIPPEEGTYHKNITYERMD